MKFQPTQYQLMNVATGRVFDDHGWDLSDPQGGEPSLVRAVYAQKQFTPLCGMDACPPHAQALLRAGDL